MKSILIISPEKWATHTVSKHHYAKSLAEIGYYVFFLSPPDDRLNEITIDNTKYTRLKVVSAPMVARGLRYMPSFLRTYMEKRWLNNFESLAGARIDIIWLFENSRFFDMRFAGDRLKVYHQVDLNQDFNVEMAAKTADICFAVSNIIKDRLFSYNKNVFKITHGTNEPKVPMALGPDELQRFELPGIHAVYVGNIDIPCLDVNLISNLVDKFPRVNFHFVGGYSNEGRFRQLSNHLGNITLWGKVSSDLIPAILEKADILLVAYKTDQWEYVANPHKFMEYFASGKVIVSTFTDEYRDKRDLLAMTDNSADYYKLFGSVIDNLDNYNSNELCAKRIDFAKAHTYSRQLDRIFQLIRNSGFILDEKSQA